MSDHRPGDEFQEFAPAAVFDAALAAACATARRQARLGELMRCVERKAAEGRATADDARRYRMALVARSLLSSPGRLPHVPSAMDAILATRHALEAERIFGRGTSDPVVA